MLKRRKLFIFGIFMLFMMLFLSTSFSGTRCWQCDSEQCTQIRDIGPEGQINCVEEHYNGTVKCGTSGAGCRYI